MTGTTGPNGSLFAATRWGLYSVLESQLSRTVTTLPELAEFLNALADSFTADLLALMRGADPVNRTRLGALYPFEHHALLQWDRLTPLVADGEHGPTRRQLLEALDAADNYPSPCTVCDD